MLPYYIPAKKEDIFCPLFLLLESVNLNIRLYFIRRPVYSTART